MKFSIVIPVFNVFPYIKECLDSLLAQSYKDWECICVDDGSNDGSAEVLNESIIRAGYVGKAIKVLRQENKGVCTARQRGLELATGEWVVFIDPDDWMDSDYLEIMVAKIAEGNYDVIWTGYKRNGENYEDTFLQEGAEDVAAHAQALMDERILGTLWCRAFRRGFLSENGLAFFNPTLQWQEDLCFVSECLRCSPRLGYASGCAYHYRQRQQSAMHGAAINDIKALIYIQRRLDRNFREYGCDKVLLRRRKWTKLAACKHILTLGLRDFSALFPDVVDVDDLPVNVCVKTAFKVVVRVMAIFCRQN